MSGPVDVRAVLNWQVRQAENRCDTARTMRGADARVKERDDLREARAAVAELIEQQKRDAQLVAVLLSYLNDNLTEREKGRLGTELMARDLSDHDQRRRAALARVQGGAA